jgi:Cu2+-exporting ATPase
MQHDVMDHGHAGHGHAGAVADFRRRFWISVALTVALSPAIRDFFGLHRVLAFSGGSLVIFGLSSIVFGYGGWPFLSGLVSEVSSRRPGMMTLIGVAITVAFTYSSAVVFGLPGKVFF